MAPRTQGKSAQIRQETQKKIAAAAFSLIAEQGFEVTSVDDIARTAGVSKGLIYTYYKSKEHLLQELITEALRDGEEALPAIINNPDPSIVLENIIRWFFKQLRERPEQWRLMTEVTLRLDRYPFMHAIATAKMQGYITLMEELLSKVGYEDPLGEARLLAAILDGVGIQALVVREDYPLDEVEKAMLMRYKLKRGRSQKRKNK